MAVTSRQHFEKGVTIDHADGLGPLVIDKPVNGLHVGDVFSCQLRRQPESISDEYLSSVFKKGPMNRHCLDMLIQFSWRDPEAAQLYR